MFSLRAAGRPHFLFVFTLFVFAAFLANARADEVTLVPSGSVWKYNIGAPGDGWRGTNFNDSEWLSGPAKLGYGDTNDVTVTDTNAAPHTITTYFRRALTVDGSYTGVVVRLLRDDGAVVYLNGTEVARSNMPDGTITPTTLALLAIGDGGEDEFHAFGLSGTVLQTGTNVLAVEIHQVNTNSSDIGFDLALIGINTNNTPPVVSIEATRPETSEPPPAGVLDPGVFTVHRTGPTTQGLSVYLAIGGTATNGTDYLMLSNVVRIEAGRSDASVKVVAKADDLVEGDETVTAEITQPPTAGAAIVYTVDPDKAKALVTIHDNPPPTNVVVSLEATHPDAREPVGDLVAFGEFALKRSGSVDRELRVYLSYGGTATPGSDYRALSNSVVIPAGAATYSWLVVPLADNLVEPDETVVAELAAPPTSIIPLYSADPDHRRAVVTIHDTTPPPPTNTVVSVVATKPMASEPIGGSNAVTGEFTFRRSGPTNASLTVAFAFGGTATLDKDYTADTNGVTFPAGVTEVKRLITPLGDDSVEGIETVTVELIAADGFSLDTARSHATVYIYDTTPLPTISIVATRADTTEPGPGEAPLVPGVFTLHRTGPTNDAFTVYLGFGGTATPGSDYTALSNTVVFEAGKSEATLFVTPLKDSVTEPDETVVAELSLIPGSNVPHYNVDPDHRRAVVTIHDINPPLAHIDITKPTNGMAFREGVVIDIKATAVDPAGYIPRVEFYDGTNKIGVSEIAFIRAPDPGTPIEHELEWKGASVGDHTLTARGVVASGIIVTSPPVNIRVVALTQVVLAVETVDASATEPNPLAANAALDTGLFVIKRVGGPTNIPVTAFYQVSGTASNGVDYVKLSGSVELDTNQMRAEIRITPLSDDVKEGDETVVLKLQPPVCIAMDPPPADCYLLGDVTSGTVVIHDQPVVENRAPVAKITKPSKGSVFTVGDSIEIAAEGSDSDGFVAKMELFSDGKSLGSIDTNRISITWTSAPVGIHILVAKATDNLGKVGESGAVAILVREKNAGAFVFRNLPDAYTPGTAFKVELRAEPPASARAYAVEDHLPTGWTVSQISNDGFFDAITGKVKFGPFTDANARTLTYMVTPPGTATGPREFYGMGSIDGASYAIGGDQKIEQGSTKHPADTNGDFRLVVDEVTAYAALWKSNTNEVNPAPLSYVTRAGYLWKHGETYVFNGSFAPPLCWVPSNAPAADLSVLAAGSSERDGDDWLLPGISAEMQINILPPAGTSAYGVEEKLPTGWTATNISDDGTFDTNTSTIRWGIFYDATARSLKYTVTPPTNIVEIGHMRGFVSFDGNLREIEGRDRVISVDDTKLPRLDKCDLEDGGIRVHLGGEAGQVGILQRSLDLINWEDVTTLFLPDGTVDYLDAGGSGQANLYYRLQVR